MKNKDQESIFNKLLEAKPNTWPLIWRKQIENDIEVSKVKESVILNLIHESNLRIEKTLKNEKKSIFTFHPLKFAFAFIFSIVGISFFYLPWNSKEITLKVLRNQGDNFIIRNQQRILIKEGVELHLRDTISITDSSYLIFSFRNKFENLFYVLIEKVGEFEITTLEPEKLRLNLEIKKGSIFVFSEKSMDREITISAHSTILQMTGTKAMIEYDTVQLSLNILEGQFKVKQANHELNIYENQIFSMKNNEIISQNMISSISVKVKEELIKLNDQILQLEKSDNSQNQEIKDSDLSLKKFHSLAEIKKEFGSIKEIILQDGTKYNGYIQLGEDKCKIIIVNETIQIDRSKILEINELNE